MKDYTGSIDVSAENIFPIIRQWLYTDKDIFVREILSNAADAITKLEHLSRIGKADLDADNEFKIKVIYDADEGIVTIKDNGIGMSLEEIDKYINEIAYSGAVSFLEEYQGEDDSGVIGHFGLGFYSSFMVSKKVRIESKSYTDAAPAYWESTDGVSYKMGELDKDLERGTSIIMYLNPEAKEEFTAQHLRQCILKYCEFLTYPIYFIDEKAIAKQAKRSHEKYEKAEDKDKVEAPKTVEEIKKSLKPINTAKALWLKNPQECTDEEYKEFYTKTFKDFREPLFWLHLNMDYPIRLKGIIYFPQTERYTEDLSNRIKVYYNQIFVSDAIRELIPEYMFLLKGVIDSPDLPLNVSRSSLQNNRNVKRVSDYISRKVADAINDLCKEDFEKYSSYYQDLSLFIKYASMKDEKFWERIKPSILLKNIDGEYITLDDLVEKRKDADDKNVYYTDNAKQQVSYIRRLENKDKEIYVFEADIDKNFINFLDFKVSDLKFLRVDSSLDNAEAANDESLVDIYKENLDIADLKFEAKALGADEVSAILLEDEDSRNRAEMQKAYALMTGAKMPEVNSEKTLVINTDSQLNKNIKNLITEGENSQAKNLIKEIYDLAKIAHGSLSSEELLKFLERSEDILEDFSEK